MRIEVGEAAVRVAANAAMLFAGALMLVTLALHGSWYPLVPGWLLVWYGGTRCYRLGKFE